MKLFILGNGFDIAHNLASEYCHFKEYLESYDPRMRDSDMPNPKISLKNGELHCNRKNAANIIWHLVDMAERCIVDDMYSEKIEWKHVEEAMGKLDYSECFDTYFADWNYEDDCPESDWKFSLKNQYRSLQIATAVLQIQDFFDMWVKQIRVDTAQAKTDFVSVANKKDLFINFNYTDILESVYGYKNVWHIHGKQGDKKIVFGHGKIDFDCESYEQILYGASDILRNIHHALYKDVYTIISRNNNLWSKLKEVTSIYTYGFSYGEVDIPYIEKIIESCTKCKEWYIEKYPGEESIKRYANTIKQLGFRGNINTFEIKN